MAQNKRDIQSILLEANTTPRKRFGQNFMIDQNLVRAVAEAGHIAAGDYVIEVGPGTGTLTQDILTRGAQVLAVEIDRDLAAALARQFADEPRLALLCGDALAGKHALHPEILHCITRAHAEGRHVKLVANLPYNIASPLVIEMLIAGVELLAFTVQKEVAQRLRAAAGADDYGPLSVMAQTLAGVEWLRTLPPQAFWPAPKIESTLLRLTRHAEPIIASLEAAEFGVFVHRLFSARRKTLRNALSQGDYQSDALLAITHLDGRQRPEEFSPSEFVRLFRASRTSIEGEETRRHDGTEKNTEESIE